MVLLAHRLEREYLNIMKNIQIFKWSNENELNIKSRVHINN
jgi:hypothetical protein